MNVFDIVDETFLTIIYGSYTNVKEFGGIIDWEYEIVK